MNCDDDNYNLAAKNSRFCNYGNISGGKSVKSLFYIRKKEVIDAKSERSDAKSRVRV